MTRVDAALVEAPGAHAVTAVEPGFPRVRLRRLARDRAALLGMVLLTVIVVSVIAAPWLSPDDPTAINPRNALAAPSWENPLGTDLLGRDLLSRILHGGRSSVAAAFAATAGIAVLALLFGVSSGLLGGVVDATVMRVVEVLQSLPLVIVAMVAVGLAGGGTEKLIITVALLGWPGTARAVRAATLSLRESDFVDAVRAEGASTLRVMVSHIIPGVTNVVAALSMAELGRIVLALSALSFLGFGVQPPNPEWGAMLADARPAFFVAPRLLFIPGAAISLLVLSVNLVGDGIRDVFDRKLRNL